MNDPTRIARFPALCALLTASLLSTTACPPKPVPVPPTPTADGGAPDTDADCNSVCDRWRDLGCSEADPTPEGARCEEVCENVQGSGIVRWDLDCRASVASCADIDACER